MDSDFYSLLDFVSAIHVVVSVGLGGRESKPPFLRGALALFWVNPICVSSLEIVWDDLLLFFASTPVKPATSVFRVYWPIACSFARCVFVCYVLSFSLFSLSDFS